MIGYLNKINLACFEFDWKQYSKGFLIGITYSMNLIVWTFLPMGFHIYRNSFFYFSLAFITGTIIQENKYCYFTINNI